MRTPCLFVSRLHHAMITRVQQGRTSHRCFQCGSVAVLSYFLSCHGVPSRGPKEVQTRTTWILLYKSTTAIGQIQPTAAKTNSDSFFTYRWSFSPSEMLSFFLRVQVADAWRWPLGSASQMVKKGRPTGAFPRYGCARNYSDFIQVIVIGQLPSVSDTTQCVRVCFFVH